MARRFDFDTAWRNAEHSSLTVRPLWSIEYNEETELLKWVEETVGNLIDWDRNAIDRYRCNCARYKGLYRTIDPVNAERGKTDAPLKSVSGKLVVNHFQDLIEQKVAKHAKYKPNTVCVPASQDSTDKNDAIVAEELLFAYKSNNGADRRRSKAIRQAVLGGESFGFLEWDRYKGPVRKRKVSDEKVVPLKDGKGKVIKDFKDDEVLVPDSPYEGDVRASIWSIENVRLGPGQEPSDREFVIRHRFEHIDRVRKDYPHIEITDEHKGDLNKFSLDPEIFTDDELIDHVLVIELWHRSNRYMPEGAYFKCLPGVILEQPRQNPVAHMEDSDWGNLPCRPLTDVDLEDEGRGFPSATNISPLQNIYDKILTLLVKNIFFASHAKWLVQKGAVDTVQLNNDSTIVEYKPGFSPPEIRPFQAFGADVFNFESALEEKMEKTIGVFSISRGAPPPGTRSAQALFFYDEQEQQRGNEFQKKINDFTVELDKLYLNIISSNYTDQDERLLRVLGREKQWVVKYFKIESIKKSWDIRVENSPNLPDSRYARLEYLMKLKQMNPQLVTDDQFADLVDFGVASRFMTPQRVAREAAEMENDAMLRGEPIKDPAEYEDHLVHLQVHYRTLQQADFKDYPKAVQDAYKAHVMAQEMLLWDAAFKGMGRPGLQQQLMAIPQFPIFYVPLERSEFAPPPMPMMPQDQSTPPLPENVPQLQPEQTGLQA